MQMKGVRHLRIYSVIRGLERSELGGSHGSPGHLWDRFLWQVYKIDSRHDALNGVLTCQKSRSQRCPGEPWDPSNSLRSKPRTEYTYTYFSKTNRRCFGYKIIAFVSFNWKPRLLKVARKWGFMTSQVLCQSHKDAFWLTVEIFFNTSNGNSSYYRLRLSSFIYMETIDVKHMCEHVQNNMLVHVPSCVYCDWRSGLRVQRPGP